MPVMRPPAPFTPGWQPHWQPTLPRTGTLPTAPDGTQLFYSSTAAQTTVTADQGTTLQVASITGFPVQYPFTLLLEWGTANQEVVTVTQAAAGSGPYSFVQCLRGQDGTTQIVHAAGAQVNHGVSARDFFQIAPMFNVCAYGADPTGTFDSAPGIQAALTAAAGPTVTSPALGVVYFPAGTYLVASTLQIPGNSFLLGAGLTITTIKMRALANLAAIAASQGWLASSNVDSTWPAYIFGITFDGNSANQTGGTGHGVVLQTFASHIENCVFQNTLGDGLRFDYYGVNGTSALTGNTGVENRVVSSQFRYNTGNGLNVVDPLHTHFTDGFIRDCIVASSGNQAINVDGGAGWSIEACHLYGIGTSALTVSTPYMTRIIGNYIESWGQSSTSGSYAAIDLGNPVNAYYMNDGGAGTAVTGNTCNLNVAPGNAATTMYAIRAAVSTGATGTLAITDNILTALDNTFPANYTAIWLMTQASTSTLNATIAASPVNGNWGAGGLVQVTNSGTITINGLQYGGTISGAGQPVLTAQTTASAAFITGVNFLAPNMTTGQTLLFNLGQGTGTRNAATWSFNFAGGSGSSSNTMQFNFFGSGVYFTIQANGAVTTLDNTLDDGGGNAAFNSVTARAGTTTVAPMNYTSGTNLTSAKAGVVEYDGISQYYTNETTSGRGLVPVEQKFRLTATGGNISTIGNFFGTTSNISLVANAEYEIEIVCWFLKNTAGTVTWTFTNSAAPTSMTIDYQLSPATGIVTTAAATDLFGQQYNVTATAPTVVSASLTTAVNHRHKFFIRLINGTGTSLKIQATAGAGSITPGINSYWIARRVPAANVGAFSA